MKIDIDQLNHFHDANILQPDAGWGDAKETACLMSALTGETSIGGCAAQGWPEWLAELGTVIFDNAGGLWWERSVAFAEAAWAAEAAGAAEAAEAAEAAGAAAHTRIFEATIAALRGQTNDG